MKKISALIIALCLFLQLPSWAYQSVGTWRAPNGAVMKIYPSFQIYFQWPNGQQNWGQGWWLREGAIFDYQMPGYGQYRAELVTNDLMLVSWNTGSAYWQRIGHRGADDNSPAPPDDTWFSQRPETATSRF